ncbi:MAG: hypothetical protein ACYS1A_14725 [Planctomycetota bacterium]|jgi:hypothetical protein
MKEKKLEKLLNGLAEKTTEPVPPGLAEEIKHQIPRRLISHRSRMDTINIIIDLRISKLAAAAAIIITMILCANFLGGRDSTGGGIFKDSKLMVRYFLTGDRVSESDILVGKLKYEHLLSQGREVVYYGDSIDPQDSNAVLIQWKISDGEYGVMFGDTRTKTVSAEELITLQARMLQKEAK